MTADLSILTVPVRLSEFHIQAAIAATHARSLSYADGWPIILTLYDQWLELNPSPTVMLNRAVAVARVHGAAAALESIAPVENSTALRRYHLLFAVKGQLLLELGRRKDAAAAFEAALRCQCSAPEARYLQRRFDECSG